MLYKGHLAAGIMIASSAAVAYCNLLNKPIDYTFAITACSALFSMSTSLLPDLDSKTSRISRRLPVIPVVRMFLVIYITTKIIGLKDIPSNNIHALFNSMLAIFTTMSIWVALGHRKILHSIWPVAGMYVLVNSLIGTENIITTGLSIGLQFGLISHILADMHTTEKCHLLYPLNIRIGIANFKSGTDDTKISVIIAIECIIILLLFYIYKNAIMSMEISQFIPSVFM